MPPESGPLRFSDILTTASAVADYHGESDVTATHMLEALAILLGEKSLDDLGRPASPLVPRPSRPGATPEVKELVQRWFEALHSNPHETLDAARVEQLRADLNAIQRPPNPLPGHGERAG